jgi:hypothetical protein
VRNRCPGPPILLVFLVSLGFAVRPVPGLAAPVAHTALGGPSVITGTYSASFTIGVHTNLGTLTSPNVNVTGNFTDNAAKPVGDVSVDWGSPAWDDAVSVEFDVRSVNLGSVTGSTSVGFNVPVIGTVGVPLSITLRMDSFSIETLEPFEGMTLPDESGSAGAGPWTATDNPRLRLTPVLTTLVALPFGGTAPGVVSDDPYEAFIPIDFELRREGGNPGTGSRAVIDLGPVSQAPFSLPVPISSPGCELEFPVIGGCAFDITSYSINLTNVRWSNVSAHIEAPQGTTPIPEPSTGLLVGLGLVWLGARRSGGARRQSS